MAEANSTDLTYEGPRFIKFSDTIDMIDGKYVDDGPECEILFDTQTGYIKIFIGEIYYWGLYTKYSSSWYIDLCNTLQDLNDNIMYTEMCAEDDGNKILVMRLYHMDAKYEYAAYILDYAGSWKTSSK